MTTGTSQQGQPVFGVHDAPLRCVKIAVFHNILWSKYKGGVFSALYRLAPEYVVTLQFVQIAETEGDRVALGGVDYAYHTYPYELIFKGAYHSTSLRARCLALAKRAWLSDADLVILPGYERPEYWVMLFTLVLCGRKRAVFCDSTAYDRPKVFHKTVAKRIFFALCDVFFGYGLRSKEYLMQHGVPEDKIYFRCQAAALPMGYTEPAALAQRLALAPKAGTGPRFLYVGRLSAEKGLPTLFQALSALRRRYPDATLRLVGAGPMAEELKRLAQAKGLTEAVTFAGSMGVDAISQEYAAATSLILPSTSEPWGLVVNEALSMGCPVLVSDRCGCVPEMVIAGATGFAFTAGNAVELAGRMQQIAEDTRSTAEVATTCIEHMRGFSPHAAAHQIIAGAARIARQAT